MFEWLKFFYDLATSFFKAFAYAVQEYPLPTAVVFLCAFAIYEEKKKKNAEHDVLLALILFVCAVIASNIVGWIFNALLAIAKALFGWTTFFAGPFGKNPIAFLLALLAAAIVGYVYSWVKYKKIVRGIPYYIHASIFMIGLFVAYIVTNVYVQVVEIGNGKAQASNPTIEKSIKK